MTRRPLHYDDFWAIALPSDPQLSPDGQKIAYVVTVPDRDRDGYSSTIWIAAADGSGTRQFTIGPYDTAPAWSREGTLAFLSRRGEEKPAQLYLLCADGGDPVAVTDLPLGAGRPVWSPDASRIAFAAPAELPGGRDHDPVVTSHLDYKADGTGLHKTRRSHLFVLDVPDLQTGLKGTTRPRQLTFGDSWASSPVWSPDSTRLAFTTSRAPDRDLDVEAVVHTVPAEGGVAAPVSSPGGTYQVVDWSPDGERLLLVGRPSQGAGNQHLYSLAVGGGKPAPLVPRLDRNVVSGIPGQPAPPRYRGDGSEILFCVQEGGLVHVLAVPAAGGDAVEIVGGDRVVAGLSAVASKVAFVAASAASPGELWLLDGTERALTDLFATALPEVEPVQPEAQNFTSPDGTVIQGWLLRGAGQGPRPLLLDIHGGPHHGWSPVLDVMHLYHQSLVADGWAVLLLNPRASDGYGEAFRTATVGAWGTADEGDFLAAVDDLIDRGIADPAKLAVSGYSYGGYMTCWLTARSDRFAAAVAGGCVSDLVSMAGTSDFGRYFADVELASSVVTARESLIASSPLTYVAGVRTPTLLIHGEEDRRCPVGQAEQWFAALREQRVPVEFVRYPGQSHLFVLNGRPSHRVDYARRLSTWIARYATGAEGDPVSRRSRGRKSLAAADLAGRLEPLLDRYRVPGASVAVLAGGQVTTAAAGVLNVETGVAATENAVFQIGSITKVYTTTLVMQLVDEGKVELDAPVVTYIPDLKLADPTVTRAITVRHLLTHTSGIQGDHFPDLGRSDDVVARFVASCAEVGQSHPVGATMSYCNSGFVIAGRVVEELTGKTWDQALASRLAAPLGLDHTVTLPEEVLRFRAAIGHVDTGGRVQPVSQWGLPRAVGPAGLICSTAADIVAFARMHLDAGQAPGGGLIVSEGSVAAMQEPQVAVPEPNTLRGSHRGLGWALSEWDGRRVYGHDGATLGQCAFLRVVPDHDVAVALLTNSDNRGGRTVDLFQDLVRPLLAELAGVTMPLPAEPPAEPADVELDQHVGTYERLGSRVEIQRRDGRLRARSIVTGPLAEVITDPVTDFELIAVRPDLFLTREPGARSWLPMVFYRLDDGSPYLHFEGRATPKVS